MAKPIEPTPTLKGKDAKRLLDRAVRKPVQSERKAALFKACDATYAKLTQK